MEARMTHPVLLVPAVLKALTAARHARWCQVRRCSSVM
jgi:hypothetical protein